MGGFDKFKHTVGVLGLFVVPFTLTYWLYVLNFDVYQYAIIGVIYEILWLPMLACLHIFPILSMISWIDDQYSLNSWHLYAFLALAVLLVYVYFIY